MFGSVTDVKDEQVLDKPSLMVMMAGGRVTETKDEQLAKI